MTGTGTRSDGLRVNLVTGVVKAIIGHYTALIRRMMINPIYEDMLSLSSDDGPCYVWPGNDNADRTHLIAAVREYLSENGVDVGPGENWPGNDVVVSAPTLLTWLRGWNTVKHLREHVSQEHWDTLDGICGCETLGWWCQDADGEVLVSGWSAQDVSHPEDLNMEYLDE